VSAAEAPGDAAAAARTRRAGRDAGRVETLFREALAAAGDRRRIRELLERWDPDETLLLGLLTRPLPVAFLEHLGTTPPWSEQRRLLGAIARNPRTPRGLALRLLPALLWRDLAEVAANLYLIPGVRVRAEGLLVELLPDLRVGDRISLARMATPAVLKLLLADGDGRVTRAALLNPRLRESDLLEALRNPRLPAPLPEQLVASPRWASSYALRLELVLRPGTPLAIALAQLTSLTPRDLDRIAGTQGLRPLLQAAARRAREGPAKYRR